MFQSDAIKGLEMILHKKLLIKQCEWNAGLTELEGGLNSDFMYWFEDVFNCPFLSVIKEQELDIYKQYFNSCDYENDEIFCEYSYTLVKRDKGTVSADDSSEPELSILYDTYMGTTAFWQLPDRRHSKEEYYSKIYHTHRMKKYNEDVAAGIIIPPKRDDRPSLSSFKYEEMKDFIKRFEN